MRGMENGGLRSREFLTS